MDKEAFKQGFIRGLAENGYTPQELEDCLEKSAGMWEWLAGAAALGLAGIAAARLAGGGIGRGAGALMQPTQDDLDAVKKKEVIDKYHELTNRAKARALTPA